MEEADSELVYNPYIPKIYWKKVVKQLLDWDPVEKLPLHVSEIIFKNLSGRELLTASSTSKLWYETIGNSLEFRKRITVQGNCNASTSCIASYPYYKEMHEIIKESERKYENLFIHSKQINSDPSWTWIESRQWKNIYIEASCFEPKQFQQLLRSQRLTLKELKLVSVDFNEPALHLDFGDDLAMQFPALKKLHLERTTLCVLPYLLRSHGCLENLNFIIMYYCPSYIEKFTKNLLRFIELNSTISIMSLTRDSIHEMFKTDAMLKLPLKLKSLKLENDEDSEIVKKVQRFIQQQGNTLEKLVIRNLPEFGFIYQIWNDLQVMTSLRISKFKCIKAVHDAPNLRPNKNLSKLLITENVAFCCLQPLLELSPNLEYIYCHELRRKMVRTVAVNCMKLKTLRAYQVTYNDIKAFYKYSMLKGNSVNKTFIIESDETFREEKQRKQISDYDERLLKQKEGQAFQKRNKSTLANSNYINSPSSSSYEEVEEVYTLQWC